MEKERAKAERAKVTAEKEIGAKVPATITTSDLQARVVARDSMN